MQEYFDLFGETLNRLEGMGSEVSADFQVAIILASFGDKNKSPFGHAITLQNLREGLDRGTATTHLLQEYEDKNDFNHTIRRRNEHAVGQAPAKRTVQGSRRS